MTMVLLAIILDRITESVGTPQTAKSSTLFSWVSDTFQRQ
jgi:glycine betaine/proline transport system permease protein